MIATSLHELVHKTLSNWLICKTGQAHSITGTDNDCPATLSGNRSIPKHASCIVIPRAMLWQEDIREDNFHRLVVVVPR